MNPLPHSALFKRLAAALILPVLLLGLSSCASDPAAAALKRLEGRWVLDRATSGYASHPLANGGGHYEAEVRSDELWITGIADRDRVQGDQYTHMGGDKLTPYRLKLNGRRFSGYVFHAMPTEAWGGVSEDFKQIHLSEKTDAGTVKAEVLRRASP